MTTPTATAFNPDATSLRADRFAWERAIRLPRATNGLPRELRLFALALATFIDNGTRTAIVSRGKLMDACEYSSKASVQTCVQRLVAAGWLEYIPGGSGRGVRSTFRPLVPLRLADAKTIASADGTVDRPTKPSADDKPVAEALAFALKRAGRADLAARLGTETGDWNKLTAAVDRLEKAGWQTADTFAAVLNPAVFGELPTVDGIREGVARLVASRLRNLGGPSAWSDRADEAAAEAGMANPQQAVITAAATRAERAAGAGTADRVADAVDTELDELTAQLGAEWRADLDRYGLADDRVRNRVEQLLTIRSLMASLNGGARAA